MQMAKVTKREEIPTEKERGEPSKGRRALEKSENSSSPSKVAKEWCKIPFLILLLKFFGQNFLQFKADVAKIEKKNIFV